jgi:tyrosyl-tRNA synthetase
LLVGRDLMPKYGHAPQIVMTTPILEGLDAKTDEKGHIVGKKMSKSADNYIGFHDEPGAMFRKVMQVHDTVIWRYFELLSQKSNEEILALKQANDPLSAKRSFARELIERFHNKAATSAAEADFDKAYMADDVPADIKEVDVATEGETLWIAKALSVAGLVKSTGEGKRLVEQGGVEVDRERVTNAQLQLERGKRYLLRVGSKNRRFLYVTVK